MSAHTPDAHIQIGAHHRPVHAIIADPTQRARLWPLLVDAYADFATYQTWTEREISVVITSPGVDRAASGGVLGNPDADEIRAKHAVLDQE